MGETKVFGLAIVPGDGIGKEVATIRLQVLAHLAAESGVYFKHCFSVPFSVSV